MLKPPDSLQGNQNRATEKCRTQTHDLESAASTWLSFVRCGQLESEVISVSDLTLMDPTVPHVKEPKTSRKQRDFFIRGVHTYLGLNVENVFILDKVTGTVRSDSSSLDIH